MAELLQVRSSIPIQCVCAVERVDENAFQQQNVMQLITQNNDRQLHIIYIQCKVTGPVSLRVRALKKKDPGLSSPYVISDVAHGGELKTKKNKRKDP